MQLEKNMRFKALNDGTVLDTQTNLMWASRDNGSNINWYDAKQYCEKYRGGGYTDWRMPTQHELASLFDRNSPKNQPCYSHMNIYLTRFIDLSCASPWALEKRTSTVAYFDFHYGEVRWNPPSYDDGERALPVRNAR